MAADADRPTPFRRRPRAAVVLVDVAGDACRQANAY
jgi:hypothetical protein